MKPATAILLIGAAGIAALVLLRPKAQAPTKGTADVLSGAFTFGTAALDFFDDDDEDSR